MIALVGLLAITNASCTSAEISKFHSVVDIVSSAQVPAGDIIAAANAFDLLKSGATQYLRYCKGRLAQAICSANNRRLVIRYGRQGTAARNQLELGIANGAAVGPRTLYDALVAATSQLSASPAQTFVAPAAVAPDPGAIVVPAPSLLQ